MKSVGARLAGIVVIHVEINLARTVSHRRALDIDETGPGARAPGARWTGCHGKRSVGFVSRDRHRRGGECVLAGRSRRRVQIHLPHAAPVSEGIEKLVAAFVLDNQAPHQCVGERIVVPRPGDSLVETGEQPGVRTGVNRGWSIGIEEQAVHRDVRQRPGAAQSQRSPGLSAIVGAVDLAIGGWR